MINKLKILGETVSKYEGDTNPLNLNINVESAHVILLQFYIGNNNCKFTGFDTLQYDQTKLNKLLLLKDIKGNKVSMFPTVFVDKKIVKTFTKIKRILRNNAEIDPTLKILADSFSQEFEKYKDIIEQEKTNPVELTTETVDDEIGIHHLIKFIVDDSTRNLCSIMINNELLGDSEYYANIRKHYQQSSHDDYFKKYNAISIGTDSNCYVCGKKSEKLYGFCDTFKFYSANEPAYIAGGFRKEKTWKNYPVCPQCANHLRLGKEKINAKFNRYFYGNNYFLIPTPTIDRENFHEILIDIEEDLTNLSLRKEEESNQQLRQVLEDEVFTTLAKQKDQLTFTFFFYAASNSEFKILHEAEDILPSRFKKIINTKHTAEQYKEFHDIKGLYKKGKIDDLRFNFGIIRTFFSSEFNNDFLDITTKILKGFSISRQFILHRIMDHIAQQFRRDQLYNEIPKAMIFTKFLFELGLIEKTKGRMEVQMDNKYEDYFQLHPDFYDADWKKAVFLTGVLAQHVLDIQWRNRNATPFRSRLNGLKLDHKAIKRLLPESIEKLEQYKANYYKELEASIAVLMEPGEPELKTQSVDEISFYFAVGMNRCKQFKAIQETEGENHE